LPILLKPVPVAYLTELIKAGDYRPIAFFRQVDTKADRRQTTEPKNGPADVIKPKWVAAVFRSLGEVELIEDVLRQITFGIFNLLDEWSAVLGFHASSGRVVCCDLEVGVILVLSILRPHAQLMAPVFSTLDVADEFTFTAGRCQRGS